MLASRFVALLFAFALVGGCENTRTQTLVFIDGEPKVREFATSVRIDVTGPDDVLLLDTIAPVGDGRDPEWALSVALSPRDRLDERFTIHAAALMSGPESAPLVEARAHVGFVSGETRSLSLVLDDSCIGVECDATETCRNARCVDIEDLQGPDIGPDETGAVYACSNGTKDGDETDIDCGGSCVGCEGDQACEEDADCISGVCGGNVCAGVDAGSDSGMDAGSDSGMDVGSDSDMDVGSDSDMDAGADPRRTCLGDQADLVINVESDDDIPAATARLTELSANCVRSIRVTGSVTNVRFLSGIDQVLGDLTITATAALISLDGLNMLRFVDGDVDISQTGLQNLEGLGALEEVGGVLRFFRNRSLQNTNGLTSLKRVGRVFSFTSHNLVNALSGFSLTEVGGISVSGVTDLAPFEGIQTEVLDGVSVSDVDDVSAIAHLEVVRGGSTEALLLQGIGPGEVVFPNLTSVEGLLVRNSNISSLSFPVLRTNSQGFKVSGNMSLSEVSAPLMTSATSLELGSCESLTSVDFSQVTSLSSFSIIETGLSRLDGMASVETITGDVNITDNGSLQSVELGALRNVGGDCTIMGNPMLPMSMANAFVEELDSFGGTAMISDNGS